MFKIANNLKNQIQPIQNYEIPEPSSDPSSYPLPRLNEFRISFADNTVAYYSKESLLKLDFFSTAETSNMQESKDRIFKFEEMNKGTFDATIAFILEKKSLFETLSDEAFLDLNLFDHLKNALTFLHPKGFKPLLEQMEEQLRFMPLAVAEEVYAQAMREVKDSGKEESLLVKVAKQIVYNSKLFVTRDEAEAHFANVNAFEEERRVVSEMLAPLPVALQDCRQEAHRILLLSQIKKLQDTARQCRDNLDNLEKITKHPSPSALLNLSRHILNPDPELANQAAAAMNRVQQYISEVRSALEGSRADMTRHDLLSYIIGPDALLFNYYGLYVTTTKPTFPFRHSSCTGTSFGYTLDNDSSYALEEEIRTDLLRVGVSLPPRLITKSEETKPILPEVQALLDIILPKLHNLSTISDEELVILKQKLIDFNGWGVYEITHSDISFLSATGHLPIITGTLTKWGYGRTFTMKINDCRFILDTPGQSNPNRNSTEDDLRNMSTMSPYQAAAVHPYRNFRYT